MIISIIIKTMITAAIIGINNNKIHNTNSNSINMGNSNK